MADSETETNTVFLTGATGVLGAHILKRLLLDTQARVACLVRAESVAHARERLAGFVGVYDPQGSLREQFERRVEIVLGDVAQDNLGLTPADGAQLAARVDKVIHAAAFTNLFSRFRTIEAVNVGGVKNMIAFALQTPSRYLCYVSTYTVIGDKTFDRSVVFRESDLDVGQGFEHMSYQHTKFLGEKLVRESSAQGLVWDIVRPGQIFGESDTGLYPQGHTNVSGLFYDIFKTIIETGVAFRSETYFDVTPVDYVSRGLLHVALQRPTHFETYHLTNPDMKTYSEVVALVQSVGYPIRMVSEQEYERLLVSRELRVNGQEYVSNTTKAFRWWFRRENFDFSASAVTDCTYTAAILGAAGIECARLDRQLIQTYISRGIAQNYFPSPSHDRETPNILEGVAI